MAMRVRESDNSELSEIRRKLEQLRTENKSLGKEIERIREAFQTTAPYPPNACSLEREGNTRKPRIRKKRWTISAQRRKRYYPFSPNRTLLWYGERGRMSTRTQRWPPFESRVPVVPSATVKEIPRPIAAISSGMNKEKIAHYSAFMDKMDPILSQMETLRISAAGRISGAIPSTALALPSTSFTGREVVAFLFQKTRRAGTAPSANPATISVTVGRRYKPSPLREESGCAQRRFFHL